MAQNFATPPASPFPSLLLSRPSSFASPPSPLLLLVPPLFSVPPPSLSLHLHCPSSFVAPPSRPSSFPAPPPSPSPLISRLLPSTLSCLLGSVIWQINRRFVMIPHEIAENLRFLLFFAEKRRKMLRICGFSFMNNRIGCQDCVTNHRSKRV